MQPPAPRGSLVLATVAPLLVAAVSLLPPASTQAASVPSSSPSPSAPLVTWSTEAFTPPFSMVVPADAGLAVSQDSDMVVVEPRAPVGPEASEDAHPARPPVGLTVATIADANVPGCRYSGGPPRARVGGPLDFLDDLAEIAGLGVVDVTVAQLDGRAAWHARLDPAMGRCQGTHLHRHALGPSIDLVAPARLTVLDVDGIRVLILVWADTEAAMAAWLPEAEAMVDSIDFR